MKIRFFLLLTLCLVAGLLYAQAPQSINSQAVLRDAAGRLIANQPVGVRITIAQGSPTGTAAYVETHAVTTNDNGLYTITIGAGTPTTGTFSAIDWGNGPYFITTDIDPAGGSSYTITTSQQFLSVPYALFADTAVRVAQATAASNATHANTSDNATHATDADRADYADTALYYRERQVLTLGHDTIYLTGGSYVVLPPSGNANINNRYIDSVIRANNSIVVNRYVDSVVQANNSTIVNHYVDSVVRANNTTVVNNIQNQISDSVRQMQTTINNTITTQMRDSIIAIIRDSATIVRQSISTLPSGSCYASCSSVDSIRHRQDSVRRAFDSVVGVQDITLRRYDSIINVQRRDIRRYDSIIRTYDSVINNYDSVVTRLVHTVDSVTNNNPSDPCSGRATRGTDTQTARYWFTWIDNRTYTESTNSPTHVLRNANAVGCDSIVNLHLTITRDALVVTDGALPGEFSVSATKKVKFSQGNLQYQASTDTWRFAEHQTDYIGDAAGNSVSYQERRDTQSAWIDLFPWGCVGYHNPLDYYNKYYKPTACERGSDDYYNPSGYGPSRGFESDLPNFTIFPAISNGGNVVGAWRLMDTAEWRYLLFQRSTACSMRGVSNVRFINTSKGLVLLPDNYIHPEGIEVPFYPNSISGGGIGSEVYCIHDTLLHRMESAGAVLLPRTGWYNATSGYNSQYHEYRYEYISGDKSSQHGSYTMNVRVNVYMASPRKHFLLFYNANTAYSGTIRGGIADITLKKNRIIVPFYNYNNPNSSSDFTIFPYYGPGASGQSLGNERYPIRLVQDVQE